MMMTIFSTSFFVLLALVTAQDVPFPGCTGEASYEITYRNQLSPRRFGSKIPSTGVAFSPLTAVAHSNRFSVLTARGYASPEVVAVAKTGDNGPLLALVGAEESESGLVKSFNGSDGGTLPGNRTRITVSVDCARPFISVVAMIAPSPDWIVQTVNRNMFNTRSGRFTRGMTGALIAYDAGVDSGADFTDPSDPSLDVPTLPPKNIAPLVEDETDPFDGMAVGRFTMRMMK